MQQELGVEDEEDGEGCQARTHLEQMQPGVDAGTANQTLDKGCLGHNTTCSHDPLPLLLCAMQSTASLALT